MSTTTPERRDASEQDDTDERPNPGDPGPEIPPPMRRDDPLSDPALPIDAPPVRGI